MADLRLMFLLLLLIIWNDILSVLGGLWVVLVGSISGVSTFPRLLRLEKRLLLHFGGHPTALATVVSRVQLLRLRLR
jgi:hypothetical protein